MSCGMEYPSGQFRSALKQNKNVTVVLIGFNEAGWDKIDTILFLKHIFIMLQSLLRAVLTSFLSKFIQRE